MGECSTRWRRAAIAIGLLSVLSACAGGLDERRATACRRAVPAIAPPGSAVSLVRIGSGPGSDSIRIDYRITGRPDASAKARWIVCRFGPGAGLDAITTESGSVNGASVYLLQRYYLDTPEAAAADPVPP